MYKSNFDITIKAMKINTSILFEGSNYWYRGLSLNGRLYQVKDE
jgi:hypothetical protein